jgi:uracil-DNA glycosylase
MPQPRGLADPTALEQRRAMLETDPDVQPLREWLEALRGRRPDSWVPDFDPAEAGIHSRVLFVLESPGAATQLEGGSGMVSVDNDDRTAETMWEVREEIGISEDDALLWNVIPWVPDASAGKPNADELAAGVKELRSLLPLLPRLEVVVLCGEYAQRGWKKSGPVLNDVTVVPVPLPSPRALTNQAKKEALTVGLARVRALIGPSRPRVVED